MLTEISRLQDLNDHPELLIPKRLLEVVDDPSVIAAVPYKEWDGSLLDEITPLPLAVTIFERDAYRILAVKNLHQKDSYRRHGITPYDRPLIDIRAHDFYPDAVKIVNFSLATDLRDKGIGKSFYENLEGLLRKMGIKYLCGNNSPKNIGFFLKMGRYTQAEINPNHLRVDHHPPPNPFFFYLDGDSTIKFLDPDLERKCVKPECLRAKKVGAF